MKNLKSGFLAFCISRNEKTAGFLILRTTVLLQQVDWIETKGGSQVIGRN